MRAPTKRPKAPKRNKTQPSSGPASKTKGGGLFGFSSGKGPAKPKAPAPLPSKPRGRTRIGKDGIPVLVPTKPTRGKGKVKPPTRERRKPTPFPGSPADMKPGRGVPVEPPIDDSGMFKGRQKRPAPKGRTGFPIQRTPEETAKKEARIKANKRKAARAAAKRKKVVAPKPERTPTKPARGKGRRKPTPTPMPTKPRRGRRKTMPIGGGRKVPFRGAMSRRRTR